MSDNPDWEKVLQYLKAQNGRYRREATSAEVEDEDFTPPQVAERKLAEDLCTELSTENDREEMREVLGYLHNTLGLVELSKVNHTAILSLTSDGFEVAHERELSKRQDKTNSALVVFTFVLIVVNWVGNFADPSYRLMANLLIGFFLVFLIFWTDILELPSI